MENNHSNSPKSSHKRQSEGTILNSLNPAFDSIKWEKSKKSPYKKSNAVKFLEQFANDVEKRKYPNEYAVWVKPQKFRDDNIEGLIDCLIKFLKLKNHWAERQKPNSCLEVVSAIIDGSSVKVLLKIGKHRQNKNDKVFQNQIQEAGGMFVIANSFGDFFKWYNAKFGSDGR